MGCTLINLPLELLYPIFACIDCLRDLSNFFISCKAIYRAFDGRKRVILFQALSRELGPILSEARLLVSYPYKDVDPEPYWDVYWDGVYDMAATYMNLMHGGDRMGESDIPTSVELVLMCRMFYSMDALRGVYLTSQLHDLGDAKAQLLPPSRTERMRVLRALYRRQVICNAWRPTVREGGWMEEDAGAMGNTNTTNGVRLGLFAALETWELQQVDHIEFFILRLCSALRLAGEQGERMVKDEATMMLSDAGAASMLPRTASQPLPGPIDKTEFGEIYSRGDCLVRYMRKHTRIANVALDLVASLPWLDSREAKESKSVYGQYARHYSMRCLLHCWQSYRREYFPDPARDTRHHGDEDGGGSKKKLVFAGDSLDLPPFAWVDAFDGQDLNWFGQSLQAIPDRDWVDEEEVLNTRCMAEEWREIGFSLWDRRRVEAMKKIKRFNMLRTGWVVR